MKLNFVCHWDKNRATTWSGTPASLFSALSRHAELVDVPLSLSPLQNAFFRARGKLLRSLHRKDFGCAQTKALQKKIPPSLYPSLTFGSYLSPNLASTYLFVDLSIEYLLDLYQRGAFDVLRYTPLDQTVPKREIAEKAALSRRFNEGCAGVFTMSQWLADYTVQKGILPKEKVHAVGGGCNIDVEKIDASRKNGNRFLFIGSDYERKNGPLTLAAFRLLKEKYPAAELYIGGQAKKPYDGEIDGVHFIGTLSHAEVGDYLNLCDYFVMPSRFEAYGLVFAEALCFGLPCIGRNAYAMPEFITDKENGRLLENGDSAEELCQCMEDLMQTPRYSETVAARRQAYLEKYAWDTVARRILAVIEADEK